MLEGGLSPPQRSSNSLPRSFCSRPSPTSTLCTAAVIHPLCASTNASAYTSTDGISGAGINVDAYISTSAGPTLGRS